MKFISEIWFKENTAVFRIRQNKISPDLKEWYRVEGTHEPIIDRELWDKVQSMVAEKAKPFTVGTIGLFARKARCMNCGYTIVLISRQMEDIIYNVQIAMLQRTLA